MPVEIKWHHYHTFAQPRGTKVSLCPAQRRADTQMPDKRANRTSGFPGSVQITCNCDLKPRSFCGLEARNGLGNLRSS
jgi:hypothetical protein